MVIRFDDFTNTKDTPKQVRDLCQKVIADHETTGKIIAKYSLSAKADKKIESTVDSTFDDLKINDTSK